MRKRRSIGKFLPVASIMIISVLCALSLSFTARAAEGSTESGNTEVTVITIEDQQVPLAGNVVIDESSSKAWLWLVLVGVSALAVVVFHKKGKAEAIEEVPIPEDVKIE